MVGPADHTPRCDWPVNLPGKRLLGHRSQFTYIEKDLQAAIHGADLLKLL